MKLFAPGQVLVAIILPLCCLAMAQTSPITTDADGQPLPLDAIAQYVSDGNLTQAEQQLRTLLNTIPTQQPLQRADVLYRLQFVLRRLQQTDAALQTAAEVLALREAYLPPDHPRIAEALRAEAELLMDHHQYEEAQNRLQRAIDMLDAQPQQDNLAMANTLQSLGMLYLARQQGEQAAEALGRALVIRQKLQTANHPEILYTQARLAMALRQQKSYERAIPMLEDVLLGEQGNGNADSVHAAIVLRELAYCHHYLRDFDRAESYYKQALSLFALNLGTHHHAYAITMQALGWLYISNNQDTAGQALLRMATGTTADTAKRPSVR